MQKLLILGLLCLPPYAFAEAWKCTTEDATGKQWEGFASFKRAAENKSLDACKKTSKIPATCQYNPKLCIGANKAHPSFDNEWRCFALDKQAAKWQSDWHGKHDKAAIAAINACKKLSSAPETCYSLPFCENSNGDV